MHRWTRSGLLDSPTGVSHADSQIAVDSQVAVAVHVPLTEAAIHRLFREITLFPAHEPKSQQSVPMFSKVERLDCKLHQNVL